MSRAAWLLLAAAGAAPAADPVTTFAVRGRTPPARLELRVEVEGTPLSAVWDAAFARLAAFFDFNGDGTLDENEAARLPSAVALRQAIGSGFTPPIGSPPAWAQLDADRDGKATTAEVAAAYRRAGLGGVLVGVGRLPDAAARTDALLTHLDADADGRVSEAEWKAADTALRKLDRNDDELIGAGELLPRTLYPGAAGTTRLVPAGDGDALEQLTGFPLVALPPPGTTTGWPAAARRLGLKEKELSGWREAPPTGRWTVQVGKAASDRFELVAGDVRADCWVAPGRMPEVAAAAAKELSALLESPRAADEGMEVTRPRRPGLTWLTPTADRDGNGSIDRRELTRWLDVQAQLTRGSVLVTVLDAEPGLFELLDRNHDGALSVRELRGAWGRVREAGSADDGGFDRRAIPRVLLVAVSAGYPATLAPTRPAAPAWFTASDRNGDGDVSRREFAGPASAFRKLDRDADGLIDAHEATTTAEPGG